MRISLSCLRPKRSWAWFSGRWFSLMLIPAPTDMKSGRPLRSCASAGKVSRRVKRSIKVFDMFFSSVGRFIKIKRNPDLLELEGLILESLSFYDFLTLEQIVCGMGDEIQRFPNLNWDDFLWALKSLKKRKLITEKSEEKKKKWKRLFPRRSNVILRYIKRVLKF